jgi:hypothetical protein
MGFVSRTRRMSIIETGIFRAEGSPRPWGYWTPRHMPLWVKICSTSHPLVSGYDTNTHTKKYTIFSCNKIAVRDRRPLSSILAEEETMVLYTANANRMNSKRVATKNEGYNMHCRIASKSGRYAPGSHWAHRPPPLKVGHAPPGVISVTSRVLSIRMKRNVPIEMTKRTPFTKATLIIRMSGDCWRDIYPPIKCTFSNDQTGCKRAIAW